jgi:hypothetical protein
MVNQTIKMANTYFNPDIKSVEHADLHGEVTFSSLVDFTTHGNKERETRALLKEIHTKFYKSLRIGDWGGGNGALSKYIFERVRYMVKPYEYNDHISITVADIDNKKFDDSKLRFVETDIRRYAPSHQFDFSLTRNTLHYFNTCDKFRFIRNMLKNTDSGALIINFTYDEKEWWERREFEVILKRHTGIERYFTTKNEIRGIVRSADWTVRKDDSYVIPNFDHDKFFRERFGLEDTVAKELMTTGLMHNADYEVTVFYCEPIDFI